MGSSTYRHVRRVLSAPWLTLRYRNGTLGVYRWHSRDYLYEQIGNSFGSAEEAANPYDRVYGNRVIQSENSMVVFMGTDVRRYDDPNWVVQQSLSVDPEQRSGIHRIRTLTGGTELLLAARDAVSDTVAAYTSSDNGSSWTKRASGPSLIGAKTGRAYTFRNRLFWPTSLVGAEVLEYNRDDDAWTSHAIPGASSAQGRDFAFATINSRLMLFGWTDNSALGTAKLFELIDGSFTLIQSVGAGFGSTDVVTPASANANNSPERSVSTLFEQSGNLYALFFGSSDNLVSFGSFATKLAPTGGAGTTFTETNITSTVLPSALRSTSNGGTATGRHAWHVLADTQSWLPTVKVILAFVDDMSGGNHTLYRWTDEATELLNTSDVDIEAEGLSFPMVPEGGGDRLWVGPEATIEIVSKTPKVGGIEEIQFIAYNDPGNAAWTVYFTFSDEEESPVTRATLVGTPRVVSGPGAVPTLNGSLNQVENVDADGVTVYGVDRDQIADGLVNSVNTITQPVITR